MSKSYKEMTYLELLDEEERVRVLLVTNKNVFTQKQNKKYLEKIRNELKQYERNKFGYSIISYSSSPDNSLASAFNFLNIAYW